MADAQKLDYSSFRFPATARIAMEVLQLFFGEPNVRMIAKSVARDPALVARILSTANSSAHGSLRATSDLLEGITRIGLETTRNILMAAAVEDSFFQEKFVDPQTLWQHSALVGQIAMRLGKLALPAETAHLHVAGSLHDIGIFVRAVLNPELAKEIVDYCVQSKCDYQYAEVILQTVSHGQIGAEFLETLKFPEEVIIGVRYHEAKLNSLQLSPKFLSIVKILQLADALALQYGPLPLGFEKCEQIHWELYKDLSIDPNYALSTVQQSLKYLDLL